MPNAQPSLLRRLWLLQPWPVSESFGWYLLQFGWKIKLQQRCKFCHQGSNRNNQHLQWRCNIHGTYLRCLLQSLLFCSCLGFRSLGLSRNHFETIITCTIGKNCNFADRQNIDYVLQEELVHGGQDEMAILCLILSLTEKSNVMPLLQTINKQTQQCSFS